MEHTGSRYALHMIRYAQNPFIPARTEYKSTSPTFFSSVLITERSKVHSSHNVAKSSSKLPEKNSVRPADLIVIIFLDQGATVALT